MQKKKRHGCKCSDVTPRLSPMISIIVLEKCIDCVDSYMVLLLRFCSVLIYLHFMTDSKVWITGPEMTNSAVQSETTIYNGMKKYFPPSCFRFLYVYHT